MHEDPDVSQQLTHPNPRLSPKQGSLGPDFVVGVSERITDKRHQVSSHPNTDNSPAQDWMQFSDSYSLPIQGQLSQGTVQGVLHSVHLGHLLLSVEMPYGVSQLHSGSCSIGRDTSPPSLFLVQLSLPHRGMSSIGPFSTLSSSSTLVVVGPLLLVSHVPWMLPHPVPFLKTDASLTG